MTDGQRSKRWDPGWDPGGIRWDPGCKSGIQAVGGVAESNKKAGSAASSSILYNIKNGKRGSREFFVEFYWRRGSNPPRWGAKCTQKRKNRNERGTRPSVTQTGASFLFRFSGPCGAPAPSRALLWDEQRGEQRVQKRRRRSRRKPNCEDARKPPPERE